MKGYLLSCKKHPFTTQKATFYKAITKHMDDTHGHRCGYMLWNTKINGRGHDCHRPFHAMFIQIIQPPRFPSRYSR